eukprot:scaffold27391_cov67-Attheya_sp.AAC.2
MLPITSLISHPNVLLCCAPQGKTLKACFWQQLADIYPGVTSQAHLDAWKKTIPPNETDRTNPYYHGCKHIGQNLPPFKMTPTTTTTQTNCTTTPPGLPPLPPTDNDTETRTAPSTPKRSKRVTTNEQPICEETSDPQDDHELTATSNQFSSLSNNDNSESEDEGEYEDSHDNTEDEDCVPGTEDDQHANSDPMEEDDTEESSETESTPSPKRQRDDTGEAHS